MSDDNARREYEEWKKGLGQGTRCCGADGRSRRSAADMGDPQNDANKMFWATLYNVVTATNFKLDSGSTELRTVLPTPRTSLPLHAWPPPTDRAGAASPCGPDRDGGETLGDRLRSFKPDFDLDDRDTALDECGNFYKVPSSCMPAVGDAVTAIMQQAPGRPDGTP